MKFLISANPQLAVAVSATTGWESGAIVATEMGDVDESSAVSGRAVAAGLPPEVWNACQVPSSLVQSALAEGFLLPKVPGERAFKLQSRRSAVLAVQHVPAPGLADLRHYLRLDQAVAEKVVSGHLSAHVDQNQPRCAGA